MMATNPLQKYFRQPKIYVSLPSKGVYNNPGSIEQTENMPVYSMTGMDEILLKTPDALLNGEATVKIIESCCPSIKNAWELSNLDIDLILTAIRIATYGESMSVSYTCANCKSQSDYDVDVKTFIEHFDTCQYMNVVALGDINIKLRPLDYKEITEYNLKNFTLQRQLAQGLESNSDEEQQKLVNNLFNQLADIQADVYLQGIESVEIPEGVVDRQEFIKEWLANSESSVYEAIKTQIDLNRKNWRLPPNNVVCPDCGTDGQFDIDLDQAGFFVRA
jgi:hypothetical protein